MTQIIVRYQALLNFIKFPLKVETGFIDLFHYYASVEASRNCSGHPEGRPERVIGYSFQLAITTPRINLIGYGTATAQS